MVERKDPSCFHSSDPEFDAERCADLDFKVRSGVCPNSCDRLLEPSEISGWHCPGCGFWTNSAPENARAN